ncbi:MAG: MFS transporter [Chloroflexi bacterium]|nr:MFS transporter [Chloroflexota bacterium]
MPANKPLPRNWWAFFLDYVTFGVGLTFASQNTVLPAFAATLTDSKVLIGSVSAVWLGAWLLPQLFAANFLAGKPRKYGYMVWGSFISRPIFFLFALLLVWGGLAKWPLLVLAIFLVGLGVFAAIDAFVAIAWFDLFGKAMGSAERGKLIGLGQVVDGLGAIGAGWLVGYLLSERGPAYPLNYAAIFGLGGLCFFISAAAIALIVEVPEAVPEHLPVAGWRDYWGRLADLWRDDPSFARVNIVRLLSGLSGLATPFYILHATQQAGINPEAIGAFAATAPIGSMLAGLILGRVVATRGSHRVIQIVSWLAFVPPLLGLGLTFIRATAAHTWVYVLCYLVIGMIEGSIMLGFFNYILDLAPPGKRPIYMGVANTLGSLLVIAPILGGWILDVSSYGVLFGLTLVGVAASAVAAIGLPKVQHHVEAEIEAAELSAISERV